MSTRLLSTNTFFTSPPSPSSLFSPPDSDCTSRKCVAHEASWTKKIFGGICGAGPYPDESRCAQHNQCASGRCDTKSFGSTPVCQARQIVHGDCNENSDCVSGLSCREPVFNGKCGSKQDGDVCVTDGACLSERCVGFPIQRCEPKVAAGGGCGADKHCTGGECFEPFLGLGRCGLKTNGVACLGSKACASGRCARGECRAKVEDGGSCNGDSDCTGGDCQAHALLDVLGGVCGKSLPLAAKCAKNEQCLSGRCDSDSGTRRCLAPADKHGDCNVRDLATRTHTHTFTHIHIPRSYGHTHHPVTRITPTRTCFVKQVPHALIPTCLLTRFASLPSPHSHPSLFTTTVGELRLHEQIVHRVGVVWKMRHQTAPGRVPRQ